MYVCGIKIAHNYTITPDDTGMPPSNTANIKVSPANISLRLVCKQIKFIKVRGVGRLEVNTSVPHALLLAYTGSGFLPCWGEHNTVQCRRTSSIAGDFALTHRADYYWFKLGCVSP